VITGYVVVRLYTRSREGRPEAHFHPMLRTTPAALEMLPEVDAAQAARE
jgi:hypothetical protein